MTRVAAIDCGTNSIRLLVADVDAATGTLVDVDRRMEIVRLGQGVDRTGRISPDAMERTLATVRFYGALVAQHGAQRLRFVATSATRDASNQDDFVDGVQRLLGVEPEVVTGDEEARLSFVGATRGLDAGHAGPFLVVDIGGGSTEVVLGGADVEAARSVDVGCVRLTERHGLDDPPTTSQVVAARADVDAALDRVAEVVPLERTRTLVGLAGSVTTVTARALGLTAYDSARIHGATLPVEVVRQACDDLLRMPKARRSALPYMHPGRVDVIGAGALVWRRVVDRVVDATAGTEHPLAFAVTSEHDILDGIAHSLV
ncbi:Ppx/GppA phosphatase family protein [Kineosporia sp. A_224]|uniref:Ppx/GppA phosphatase family protein n=1 Tax=Kineosporia sp. A_224 TaxID=1962180 RepID=UPI000B4BD8A3|nr:Ppx/GppA phosphatase family protein [Kineosporia sp. A_224]